MSLRLSSHWVTAGAMLVYAVGVLGAGFGVRDPWPPDEPRFALIAKEMAETGEWLFPHIAGELYADKPPLFFWVVAGLYRLTGALRVALFLPALLAALVVLGLVFDLARRLWGPRVGVQSAAALALTVQFQVEGRAGQIDGFLLGLVTLSLYGLLRHLLLGPAWGWWVVGWAAAGAGIITKGVGFLPLLVLLPYLVWGRGRMGGEWWRWAMGPLALTLVVGLWFVPMVLAAGSGDAALAAYRDEILLRQTVTRYADPWHHHQPPWYFLLNVIPVFWLPVVVLLPWLVPRWRQAWRGRELPVVLPLAWVVLVLLFFSLSPGKRGVYILPALPALVLAAAPWLEEIVARRGVQRTGRGVLVGIAAVLGLAAVVARWWPPAEVERYQQVLGWQAWIVLLAGWAGATLALWLGLGWGVLPRLDGERSGRALMGEVRVALPPGGELAVVGWKEQFILQAGMPVEDFGFRRRDKEQELAEALAWAAQSPGRRVLVAENHPGFVLAPSHRARDLGVRHRQRWWLVSAEDVAPAGALQGGPVVKDLPTCGGSPSGRAAAE